MSDAVQTQQKEHPEARKCWKQRERRNEELGSQSACMETWAGARKSVPRPQLQRALRPECKMCLRERILDQRLRIPRFCAATQPLCDQGKPLSLSGLSCIHLED